MRKLLDLLMRPFGLEVRRRAPRRSAGYDEPDRSLSLGDCLEKAEGMIGRPEAELLYAMAKDVREGCILEVGSYRGRSAVALGRGSMDGHGAPVYCIEPHEPFTGDLGGRFGPPDRGAFYRAMLDTTCFHPVRLVNLSSEAVAPNWTRKIGLLWIDGDHSYEGVKRDFECWAPHLLPGAPVAFDDTLNPEIGPHRLVAELEASGRWRVEKRVGPVAVLRPV